jgi:hypothetical protein
MFGILGEGRHTWLFGCHIAIFSKRHLASENSEVAKRHFSQFELQFGGRNVHVIIRDCIFTIFSHHLVVQNRGPLSI